MTTNRDPNRAVVRGSMLRGKSPGGALNALEPTCDAGAQCVEVQNDPVASAAFAVLKGTVTRAQANLTRRDMLALALRAAERQVQKDSREVRVAYTMYEESVNVLARGDAALISKAGLPSRDAAVQILALDRVPSVRSKLGKNPGEALVGWAPGPGATCYAIEVNFSPEDPTAWIALPSGTARTRVVKAPAPGAQFLVRIASLRGQDRSAWSDTILATAR